MVFRKACWTAIAAAAFLSLGASPAFANHKLGKLHWAAETASTVVNLTLDDSGVASSWRPGSVRSDWAASDQIDFNHSGAVEITAANDNLGNNGYLGAAFITYTPGSGHIIDVEIQLNDFYSLTNDQKQSVYCQELGHGLGLGHLHSRKYDPSTSCMSDAFALHPNAHDYTQLQLIYDHADGFNGFGATARRSGPGRATVVIPAR